MNPHTLDLADLRAHGDTHSTLVLHPSLGPVLADAVEIADADSVALIESHLVPEDGWYDVTPYPEVDEWCREAIALAVRYLLARGLLERHAEKSELVRLVER